MIEKILARYKPADSNRTTPSQNINAWTQAQATLAPGATINGVAQP